MILVLQGQKIQPNQCKDKYNYRLIQVRILAWRIVLLGKCKYRNKYKFKYRLYQVTSLASSIVLIGKCKYKYKYKYKYRLYQATSLAWSIVLIGGCNANTTTGRSGRDLTCDWPFKGQPLLAIQHTAKCKCKYKYKYKYRYKYKDKYLWLAIQGPTPAGDAPHSKTWFHLISPWCAGIPSGMSLENCWKADTFLRKLNLCKEW